MDEIFEELGQENIVLRPLQKIAVDQCREAFKKAKKFILKGTCGFGKTVLAAYFIKEAVKKDIKCLFVVDRIVLAGQTSKTFAKYGISHGIIQADNPQYFPNRQVQIGSIATLNRRDIGEYGFILIDECFTGDTIISMPKGDREIRLVNRGDIVYNACGYGVVNSVSKLLRKTIIVRLSNGKRIECTESHPFFTESGWKEARELDGGERLFSQEDMSYLQTSLSSKDFTFRGWPGKDCRGRKSMEKSENLFSILLKEIKQPNAQSKKYRQGCEKKERKQELFSTNKGWKWINSDTTKKVIRIVGRWLGFGIYTAYKNKNIRREKIAESFQNRYLISEADDSYRGRRFFSLFKREKRARWKKRQISEDVRVESVEVNKFSGFNHVYNLEISSHPSYFAGGILVHNCHCHHKGHTKLLEQNKDSFIMGLTATPYAKDLGKYYDFFIEPVPVKQMVKEKELVPLEIYGPEIADLSKLKIRAGEFTEESLSEAYDQVDIVGDVVKIWKKLTPGKKTIIFGVNVAHIKHISKEFNKGGVKACQINAYQSPEERKEALDGFIFGDTTALCSVEVATKGFDCPQVEVVVLAVATKSHMKWEQTCGRGYRLSFDTGKFICTVLDCGGNAERLGYPDEYEFLTLDIKNKNNSKAKKKEIPEKLPKKCVSCDFIKPAGVRKCPACGFVPDFIEDVEVADGDLKKVQRKSKKEYTIKQKQSFLSQLNQYCLDNDYKFGWASHKYKEKFGTFPRGITKTACEPIGEEVRKWIKYINIKSFYKRKKEGLI